MPDDHLQGDDNGSLDRCVCPIAGFCSRHGIHKPNHFHKLCQRGGDYWQAWERGRGPGQRKPVPESRKRVVSNRESVSQRGRAAWKALFNDVHTKRALRAWEKKIPKFGCGCNEFYKEWKRDNPPGDSVGFEWKWRLKSAVNEKLGKDNLTLDEAIAVHCETNNPPRSDIAAVTAFSINNHSIERQRQCVDSWRQFGLTVYARNTVAEIKVLRSHFPDVKFIPDDDVATRYAFPTQKIRNLARTAIEIDRPVLLINSDCELQGSPDWLSFDERTQFVGVRWNYQSDRTWITEFRYGLDAFSFTPPQAAIIPHDFFLAIGQPCWDYAVPALMRICGVRLNVVHRPMMLHLDHPQHWRRSDWDLGRAWMRERLGTEIEWGSTAFRDGLEADGWRYGETRWVLDQSSSH